MLPARNAAGPEDPVRSPYLLRLPFWLAARFDLALLLSHRAELSGTIARRWLEVFALSGPETAFARRLLVRKRNLWLFRCHQRRFCGDFAIVDMSGPARLRRAWFIELKQGAPLRFDVGGIQLQQVREAAEELAGIVEGPERVRTVMGGGATVLDWLEGRHPGTDR